MVTRTAAGVPFTVDALRQRRADPDDVELITVPGLADPSADEPGPEPAAQLRTTIAVDDILTQWFVRQLTRR